MAEQPSDQELLEQALTLDPAKRQELVEQAGTPAQVLNSFVEVTHG